MLKQAQNDRKRN